MRDDRGRLTLPGVVLLVLGFAYLGVLAPVYISLLNKNVHYLSTGEAGVYQLFVPFLLLVIIALVFRTSEGT